MSKNTRANSKKTPKIRAGVVAVQAPVMPRETDKTQEFIGEWVQYFKDDNNNFPNELAKRSKRASVHNAIIQSKVTYTCGEGLSFERDGQAIDFVTSVNNKGESLEDLYEKCAIDLITVGSFGLQQIVESGIPFYFHQDTTEIRLQKEDDQNKINNAYISPDWPTIGGKTTEGSEEEIKKIPMWSKGTTERESIMYSRQYTPEHRYYGLPDYVGALHWIDISYKIPTFNLDRFKNGFMPSAVVDLVGEPPEGMTPEEYITDVVVPKFTDEGNNSKILFQMVDSQENKTNVQLFDGIKDGDFTELQQLADQNIISAHRWHPSLSGIQTAGKLGTANEIRSAFEIVDSTVIRGYKMSLITMFEKVLKERGFDDVKIKVHTKPPISFISSINIQDYLTPNEIRAIAGFEPLDEEEQTEE